MLIAVDAVILARESVEKPYTFRVVEVLKGTSGDDDFDGFINSWARRMLKQNSEDAIVFTRQDTEPGWQYMAYADTEYQKFVRAIIAQSARWQEIGGDQRRIDFFAKYLNHSDQLISEQAYLEVGRAPYAEIRRIADSVPRHKIRQFLLNWRLIEWHSLYILMLGQSRHPEDLTYIRHKLETAAAYGFKTNLSAWVTAFIEVYPKTGVEEIETLYFSTPDRTRDELQEVLKALSVLGSDAGSRFTPDSFNRQRRIVSSYGTLLDNHPMMAGQVAKDLTIWKIQALVDPLSGIIVKEPGLDPDAKMAVSYYLSIAPRFPAVEYTP